MKYTLAEIQELIDKCNDCNGCDDKCTKKEQRECDLLKMHTKRTDYCRKKCLPFELW